VLHYHLQLASGLVHAQTTPQLNAFAIARHEIEQLRSPLEHGTAQLALCVLDREVTMTAGCAGKPRNLSQHRHRIEPGLQGIRHSAAQGANWPNAGRQTKVIHSTKLSCRPAQHLPKIAMISYNPLISLCFQVLNFQAICSTRPNMRL
jgi:hypothetical protein